jgi:pyridoxine/pyridoxamine 5'-phosphate oxidase
MMEPSQYESLTGLIDFDFPEYEVPPSEPMDLARSWFDRAKTIGVREPGAMCLSTVASDYRVSSRVVSVTEVSVGGLNFSSHNTSRKGKDIGSTGYACGLFYWRELGQQLIVAGGISEAEAEEADRVWAARPNPLHYMSALSHQSDPLNSPEELRAAASKLQESSTPIERPQRFVVYRMDPKVVEFWSACADRMHRRLRYERSGLQWLWMRLQP